MTRASTPGSLSTRTDKVCCSIGSAFAMTRLEEGESSRLHHDLAFLGDGVLRIDAGVPEQHLVVRAARRNHREAVFVRVDHAVEDHRARRIDHLTDGVVEL